MSEPTEQLDQVEEYQDAVRRVALVASMLADIDFAKLIRAIDHADAVGPILNPTLWRDRHKAMHEDRALLVAAQNLVAKSKRPAVPNV
jgi:hypothetical protein